MKNKKEFAADLWKCVGCGAVDTFLHLKWCPAYQQLREGKDLRVDKDLVTYITNIMTLREGSGD